MDSRESQSYRESSSQNENFHDRQYNIISTNENQSSHLYNTQSASSNVLIPQNETQVFYHNFICNNFEYVSTFLDWSDPSVIINYNIRICDCSLNCRNFHYYFLKKLLVIFINVILSKKLEDYISGCKIKIFIYILMLSVS